MNPVNLGGYTYGSLDSSLLLTVKDAGGALHDFTGASGIRLRATAIDRRESFEIVGAVSGDADDGVLLFEQLACAGTKPASGRRTQYAARVYWVEDGEVGPSYARADFRFWIESFDLAGDSAPTLVTPGSLSDAFLEGRRIRLTRSYNFAFVGDSSTCEIPFGQMSVGSTVLVTAPVLSLTTATGVNKIAERGENLNNTWDFFRFRPQSSDPDGTPGYWGRPNYTSCIVMANVGGTPPSNSTATQFVGMAQVIGDRPPPFPADTVTFGGDAHVMLYARTSDGTWFLDVDTAADRTVTTLTGVEAFTPDGTDPDAIGFFCEIEYEPLGTITAKINGIVGASITSTIDPTAMNQPHKGAGVFVTSGTHASGVGRASFMCLTADTLLVDDE